MHLEFMTVGIESNIILLCVLEVGPYCDGKCFLPQQCVTGLSLGLAMVGALWTSYELCTVMSLVFYLYLLGIGVKT
jgi:hypothetical protein